MMFFCFELANIIWMVLAKLFQAVSRLLGGFMPICSNCLVIERVHAVHVLFVQRSSIVAAELFKLIRYTAVDAVITNIVRQNRAGNAIGIKPVVFAYAVRCTVIVSAFSRCYEKVIRKKGTQSFR